MELLEQTSEDLGRGRAAAGMLRGGLAPQAIADAVRDARADVVHAHNINPLLGPRSLVAAKGAGARVVMHLHNYRLVCAKAIAYRAGRPCTSCQGSRTWPAVRHRCRDSLVESGVYALGIARQQRRVLASVDAFGVPSQAAVERLATLGLPTHRMSVLPNFLRDGEFAEASQAGSGKHALYAGRLVEEKGVDTAIAACARAGVPLVVAGEGPAEAELRSLARRIGADVRFVGQVDAAALRMLRQGAGVALVPSRWDEPCPYSVIESLAVGVPVIASDVGGLPEMVGERWTLPARDVDRWSGEALRLWNDPGERRKLGEAALAGAKDLFGADRFYRGLMRLYGEDA